MNVETQADLQSLIDNQVPESLSLEYKRAAALDRNKADEIVKDVSALANSAGGTLIYGIAEASQRPTALDPIDRSRYSQEWLAQIISNIQPKLAFQITVIPLIGGPDQVAYVVNVPQGSTAHQARDLKYHKRHGTITAAMQDYEIRDAMNRQKYPSLVVHCSVARKGYFPFGGPPENGMALSVVVQNNGPLYAKYVMAGLYIPTEMLHKDEIRRLDRHLRTHNDGGSVVYLELTNELRPTDGSGNAIGEPRHHPVLPTLHVCLATVRVENGWESCKDRNIYWRVFADNAPAREGAISVKSMIADGR